jgi:hypothetical protein
MKIPAIGVSYTCQKTKQGLGAWFKISDRGPDDVKKLKLHVLFYHLPPSCNENRHSVTSWSIFHRMGTKTLILFCFKVAASADVDDDILSHLYKIKLPKPSQLDQLGWKPDGYGDN